MMVILHRSPADRGQLLERLGEAVGGAQGSAGDPVRVQRIQAALILQGPVQGAFHISQIGGYGVYDKAFDIHGFVARRPVEQSGLSGPPLFQSRPAEVAGSV